LEKGSYGLKVFCHHKYSAEYTLVPQWVRTGSAPPLDLALLTATMATSDPLAAALRTAFGLSTFRPLQRDIIEHTMAGGDSFVLMPTGGGKSLCYQLPSVLHAGKVVVVFSPLLALMADQAASMVACGVRAVCVSSTAPAAELRETLRDLASDDLGGAEDPVRLVYTTPEQVGQGTLPVWLTRLADKGRVALFAVDEAHCISSWGHDFRGAYRRLSRVRERYPRVPLMALTATATEAVRKDVVVSLRLSGPALRTFRRPFDRPNISYAVIYSDALGRPPFDELTRRLKHCPCAIVYARKRDDCEDIAAQLRGKGLRAVAYHAGLPKAERAAAQADWTAGDVDICVATIAFGMGIDVAAVRVVVHWNMPQSLEAFYQETGRAGRDGKPSRTFMFYSASERSLARFLARKRSGEKKMEDKEEEAVEEEVTGQGAGKGTRAGIGTGKGKGKKKGRAEDKLEKVIAYAERALCRRRMILEHFGDTPLARAAATTSSSSGKGGSSSSSSSSSSSGAAGGGGERVRGGGEGGGGGGGGGDVLQKGLSQGGYYPTCCDVCSNPSAARAAIDTVVALGSGSKYGLGSKFKARVGSGGGAATAGSGGSDMAEGVAFDDGYGRSATHALEWDGGGGEEAGADVFASGEDNGPGRAAAMECVSRVKKKGGEKKGGGGRW
jgi:RecQ family ATP-dependent DNA helicase